MKNLINKTDLMDSSLFEELFHGLPVSAKSWRIWEETELSTLEKIAWKLRNANAYVFVGDARHFWQFASWADWQSLCSLTEEEHTLLLGEWDEKDWDPEFFGYTHPINPQRFL